jgi:hypothetical protein
MKGGLHDKNDNVSNDDDNNNDNKQINKKSS